MGSSFSGSRYLHSVVSKLHLDLFHLQTSPQLFLLYHQMKTHEKIFWWVFFKLSPALGMICVNKNMHLAMQHPSSGAMTAGPTDRSEILIPMPMPGQEPSMYICLSPAKIADFMHPKWERCIVINSLIFVVVCKNILYCLNLEPASNKKRMTGYIKNPHTNIFIGQTGFGKTQLVLELIEKE